MQDVHHAAAAPSPPNSIAAIGAAVAASSPPPAAPQTALYAPPVTRTFSQFLAEIEDGDFQAELTEALREAVAALSDRVKAQGGKPRAKIKIDIALAHESGTIEVKADFKAELPKPARGRSIFWATPDNALSKSDPRQQRLPLREVTDRRLPRDA